jgi:hypothetical protein
MLAGQHLDLSKNGTGPKAEGCRGFYASECGSKQVGRTKANVAVSFLLGGYNLSHYLKVTADHTNTSVKPGPGGGRKHICETWPGQGEGAYLQIFLWVSLSVSRGLWSELEQAPPIGQR